VWYRHFEGKCCLHLRSRRWRLFSPGYRVSVFFETLCTQIISLKVPCYDIGVAPTITIGSYRNFVSSVDSNSETEF
jgi:hypothetical protein